MLFNITEKDYEFLALQKGKLHNIKADREAWADAYTASINLDLRTFVEHLPKDCKNILDIGSGLGGMDAAINKACGGGLEVCLLDGEADQPSMVKHNQTFNNMEVARDFQARHGVSNFSYMTPTKQYPRKFDLIISFGSWCFHYPPEIYLPLVIQCCTKDTVLILEVRKDHPDNWLGQLKKHFKVKQVVETRTKFDRIVFEVKK